MNKGDIASLIAGVAIVVAVATVYYGDTTPSDERMPGRTDVYVTVTAIPTPTPTGPPEYTGAVYRIRYTDDYFSYPVWWMPDNLTTYGGSDPPAWRGGSRTIARLEEEHGGVSEIFVVHSPVWRLNCTVDATGAPAGAMFGMMCVDARSGEILNAGELRGTGIIQKNIHRGGNETYIVVDARSIDRFSITVETDASSPGYVTPSPR
ncbi:MAG: hypothetical protein ACXQTG_05920 [Methanoculleaceae archaeon]